MNAEPGGHDSPMPLGESGPTYWAESDSALRSGASPSRSPSGIPRGEQQERHWLDAIAERRTEPLAELYDRYAATVMGYVLAWGCDRALAEGVVAGAFLRLWRVAPLLDSERVCLRDWLLLTAASFLEGRRTS